MVTGPAPCGGRFDQPVPHVSQPSLSWPGSAPGGVCQKLSPAVAGYCLFLFLLLCSLYLRPPDIVWQLPGVILDTLGKNRVKDPQHLTCHRYHRLHLFERVLLPRPVILVYLAELCVLSHQRYCDIAASYSTYLRRFRPR